MKKYQAIYENDHIVYYPSYGRGLGMKWYSGILFFSFLILLTYSIIIFEYFLMIIASISMAFMLFLWIVADRAQRQHLFVLDKMILTLIKILFSARSTSRLTSSCVVVCLSS